MLDTMKTRKGQLWIQSKNVFYYVFTADNDFFPPFNFTPCLFVLLPISL